MMDATDKVAALIRLNGGEIVGKTRLQKIVYLLEEAGLGFGLGFDYHNFGPFSSELAFAADDAVALGLVEKEERFGAHQMPYTVFRATDEAPEFKEDSTSLSRQKALSVMEKHSALVLELGATALYLKNNGYKDDPWAEVKRRKPSKAVPELVTKAKALLKELGLS